MRKILSFVAAMLFVFAANAAVINIQPGESVSAKIAAAEAGDVFILADGTYEEGNQILFYKSLTLQAAEGASPIIANRWYSEIGQGADVTIKGIKFDGTLFHDTVGASDHCFRAYNEANGTEKLTFEDCEFTGYPNYVIYFQKGTTRRIDALTIKNCYFHDNKRCAVFAGYDGGNSVNSVTIQNSTFANFTEVGEALISIKNSGTEVADQAVRVDHCTFYNFVKASSGDYSFIDVRKSTDVHISNCIFAQPTAGMSKATYCYGGAIDTCLIYNTNGHRSGSCVVTGSIEADPLFVDAANLDLHLGEGSPALGAGTDGSNLGDPRWWPAAPVPPTPQPQTATYVMTPNNATTGSASTSYVNNLTEFTYEDISWKMAYWNPSSLQVKTNQDSPAAEFRMYTTSAFPGKIKNVVVTFSALTLKNTSSTGFMFVGGSEEVTATTGGTAGVWDATEKTLTWTPAETDDFTYFALYQNGKVATGTNKLADSAAIVVTYEQGAAPAVAKPAIAGEVSFYGETAVTITCDTEGAAIYYTLDGTEPTAASTQYTAAFNLTASATVKAIAILGSDASAVAEKTFTKNPSFASFEELIAAGLADNTLVEVSFANLVIDSIYVSSQNAHKGVYFTVDGAAYEIYYSNGDAAVPAEWVVGGKVSGTIRGNWTVYKGLWELVPTAPWAWANLTYAAPVTGCDWDNIEFLGGPAEYANQFKVCVGDPAPTQVVNIQQPDWATKLGIFMSFPAAPISAVSLGEGNYAVDGAGCVLYVSAFTAKETEVTITANNVDYVVTVYNANGTEPIIGGPNYYLVGSMNNWTPGLTDVFEANPGAEGEYMAKATLAVGDEFKVIGITSGVLNPDTTWYPEGTNNNYIVDVDHAGAAKNIYFRPDGQGGEGWHYGVIFVEPNQDALKAVSDSTTWNFSKLTQNTESSLYNSDKEGILLSASTNPSITDELIYAGYDSLWTIAADFDGEAIAFTGEYPIRKNQYCMNGKLRIKTTVAGNIYVKFSDTGTSASDNPTRRYLVVNSDTTEYWTSRPKKNDDTYESRLNVETGAIHVPAGDVIITGSQAICVYYVTFVPDAAPIVNYYVAGSMNDWKADENYMLTPNNESLYEGEFTFAANDAFKVIGYDGSNTTWYPEGTNNDYKITEAGDYKITFNPAGNVEGWYAGFFNVVKKETPVPVVPTTAPAAPTAAEDDVMALYCNHYATNNLNFGVLGWGGVTTWTSDTIDGTVLLYCSDMKWEIMTNWDTTHYDMSAYKKFHADIWAPAAAKVKLTFEALGGAKPSAVFDLAEGWTAIDAELTQWADYDFKDMKYFIFEGYTTPEGASFENNPFAFANIYFYDKEAQGIENLFVEGKAVKVLHNGQILILKNNKVYTVTGQPVNMK